MTDQTQALLEFHGVSKAFGAKKVLKGVDLSIPRGCFTFVVGPSGTGKSVMFKCLVGFLEPDTGQVFYDGQDLSRLDERGWMDLRKRCSYVFQHPALFDSMTVLENVKLVVDQHFPMLGERGILARAQELLELVGLGDKGDLSPLALAGGEQKLVSIARAMALSPESLILDEPTTGLDPAAARSLDRQLSSLMHAGTTSTIVVVSHDLRSIRALADLVVMLLNGRVHFLGTTEEFFSSSDPAVRQFVSANPKGPIG